MITFAAGHQVLAFADRGIGLIVCPDPVTDRAHHGQTSMHAQERASVMSRLRALGWELVGEDDSHGPRLVGTTQDGRPAYELRLVQAPPLDGAAAELSILELCQAAAVIPLG